MFLRKNKEKMQDKKMDWEEEERVRDKNIVAASDCRGLIVFEALCGIYVMVDCIYNNTILL